MKGKSTKYFLKGGAAFLVGDYYYLDNKLQRNVCSYVTKNFFHLKKSISFYET